MPGFQIAEDDDQIAPAVAAAAVAPKAGSQVQAVAPGANAPVVAAIGASDAATAVPAAGEAIVALRVTQDSWFSVRGKDGKEKRVPVLLRIDTPIEVDYYKHGGILPFVLRSLLAA